MMKLKKIQSN
jgi:hypothetical protein